MFDGLIGAFPDVYAKHMHSANASETRLEFSNIPAGTVLGSLLLNGRTIETGSGDKSPDNPYMLAGVTKLTISDGGSNLQTVALPQPLYSLPDGTADDYEAVSGSGTQRVGRMVLNGSESWGRSTYIPDYATTSAFRVLNPNVSLNSESSISVNSDKFKPVQRYNPINQSIVTSDIECIAGGNGYIAVRILKSRLTGWLDTWTDAQKLAAFKAWLTSNPVTVLYELAEPQTIAGTAQTIPTYYPYTQITNDAGAEMVAGLKYGNLVKLMSIFKGQIDELYQVFLDIQSSFDVDTAVGASLDKIGANVGIRRTGWQDNLYRILVKNKISQMLSGATIGEMMDMIDFVFSGGKNDTRIVEVYPASMQLFLSASLPLSIGMSTDLLNAILNTMRPGGVYVVSEFEGTFEFGEVGEYGVQSDIGLSDIDRTVGGTLSYLFS